MPLHITGEIKQLDIGSDVEIAKCVMAEVRSCLGLCIYSDGSFWHFDKTQWSRIDESVIRRRIHAYDGSWATTRAKNASIVKLGQQRIGSILHECAFLVEDREFFAKPAVGINCTLGFIRFDTNGHPTLEKHSPDHRCRHTLPGSWDPSATGLVPETSLLYRLLWGSFKDDEDAAAKIDLLAEILGVAALGYATRIKQPLAVVLYGRTAENGKSQILELARGLLPPSAIASVPASKMADEKHIIGLNGKLLNTADELSNDAISSEVFKAVVTGDPVQGRDVYKSRVEFRSLAQNLFATNYLPGFKGGLDRGVRRRLMVIPFNRTIPINERIEGVGRRVCQQEADLLLAWAVAGASRVIKRGEFSVPASCHEALNDWIYGSDPVLAWIETAVQVVPVRHGGPILATKDAYKQFSEWASAEGFRNERLPSVSSFVQRVQSASSGITSKRTAKGRVFIGLEVKWT